VDSVDVVTTVYLPPPAVYEFLADFPRYADYSKHLREVRVVDRGAATDRARGDDGAASHARGAGAPGTIYELTFAWWKLSYTARSEVTDVDPPARIDWRIVEDFVASGYWHVEAVDPPDGREHASRVTFHVDFRPETADDDMLSLPRFVSLDWVIETVTPKITDEAERVVRRIVADLEGESRDVDLEIRTDARL
jgi:hypothetical protein